METPALDRFRVPDPEYNHIAGVVARETVVQDRFKGYRALEPDDWTYWMQAIEDAGG
jgi:hypothetical protein